ncbi:MAG: molybdopterin-binding protein, partial [Nannocystaceae bacterium]
MDRRVRAQILTVGDELLSGAVVDTNLTRIGRFLDEFGVEVVRAVSVGDSTDEITHALRLAGDCDLCVVSGGLGPTSDDRTAAGVAQAAEVALAEDAEAWRMVQVALGRIVARREKSVHTSSSQDPSAAELQARNRKQALLPVGGKPIANARGTAPGFELELQGREPERPCWVVCLPGVPRELAGMLGEEVGPRVQARFGGKPRWSRTYRTLGVGESWVACEVEEVLACARKRTAFCAVEVHYLATIQHVLIRIELADAPPEEERAWLDEQILAALGPRCFGLGPADLPTRVVAALTRAGLTVATADAVSGGQMGVLLTGVPGASRSVLGGVAA